MTGEAFVLSLVGLCDGKGTLERHERRWDYNIKMDLHEMEWVEAWTGSSLLRIGTGGWHF